MSHLKFARQTYLQHLRDSFKYGLKSLKASFLFFVHGIFPEYFTHTSDLIFELNDIIKEKYENIKSDII